MHQNRDDSRPARHGFVGYHQGIDFRLVSLSGVIELVDNLLDRRSGGGFDLAFAGKALAEVACAGQLNKGISVKVCVSAFARGRYDRVKTRLHLNDALSKAALTCP